MSRKASMKIDFALIRVTIHGLEYWIITSDKGYRICRAYPFDTQADMHESMKKEGRSLTDDEYAQLKKLL